VTAGEVATLVAWRLDRSSRRGIGQVGQLLEDLERADVAAASVAAVVGAVVGIENYHPDASKPVSPATNGVVVTSPATTLTSPIPSTQPGSPTTASSDPATLHGVQIVDLTFYTQDKGWALASADCPTGLGRCTALLTTPDGTHWQSRPGAKFNVPGITGGCTAPCVNNIRFGNVQTGYAFGPNALFMTTDGGTSWQQQAGGALFLESLNNNVVKVTSTGTGCPSWCNVQAETSAIGSTTWTPASLPSRANQGFGVEFARGGHDAYLLFTGHASGGASNATSTFDRSTDDGQTWTASPEPCPQTSEENDSTAVAAAPNGRVSVLCMVRQAPNRAFVATSTDAAAHFTAQPGTVPAATVNELAGDPATVLIAAGEGLSRSTDSGRSWTPVPDVTGTVSYLGFESQAVGRAVANKGRTIWTTRDAGATWTPVTFG
jgi:hypothetical protein